MFFLSHPKPNDSFALQNYFVIHYHRNNNQQNSITMKSSGKAESMKGSTVISQSLENKADS